MNSHPVSLLYIGPFPPAAGQPNAGRVPGLGWAAALSEALPALANGPVSAILLDLRLPEGARPAFAALRQASPLPILLYGSPAEEDLANELLQAGAQDFLLEGETSLAGLQRAAANAILRLGTASRAADLSQTAQKELDELRRSAEEYRLIAEHSSDVIWLLDMETLRFIYVSPSVYKLRGFTPQEVMDQPMSESLTPESLAHVFNSLPARLAAFRDDPTKDTHTDYLDQLRKDGSLVHTEVSTSFVRDNSGRARVVGISRDISASLQAQEQLRQVNQRFSEIASHIQEVFWMSDGRQGKILYVSPAYELVWGRSSQELYTDSRQYFESVAPEDRPAVQAAVEKQNHGQPTELEYRIRRGDGALRWIWDRSFPVFDETGALAYTTGVATDITERKQAEQSANLRQAQLEKVLRLGKNITAITDLALCLREIYHSIRFELGFDRVGLFLYHSETQQIQGVWGTSQSGEMEDTSWFSEASSQSGAWTAALQSASGMEFVEDFQGAFTPGPQSDMYGVKNYVTLAAWAGDKPVAVIAADNLLSQRPISPADREALQLFTGYVGLAIENARLNAGLERRVEERTTDLRQSEATYRALFENSNDAIFLFSPNGKTVRANQRALDLIGCTWEEYQEQQIFDSTHFVAPEQKQDADERFAALLRGETVPLYERILINRQGERLDVEINLSAVRDPAGNVLLVQSVVRDIRQRKLAAEALFESRDQLSAANAALERASRLKDEFLASMSHELRTPLTSILGLSEALQYDTYGPLNEKQLKALVNIESSGRHLLELINDILDLSKIEAGKLDLQIEPCNAGEVCQSSLQLVRGMAQKKAQKVSFRMNQASITLHADARRLKQVLVNLLSNAVKFTPEGGSLGLDVQANPVDRVVVFRVWDEGIGIKPTEMDKLFKPFIQLDSSLARQHSGTGLGLSLVQRLVEMHGGGVTVESTPGKGSAFSVALPWQPAPTGPLGAGPLPGGPAEAQPGAAHAPDPHAPLVLVADDNEMILETLCDYLAGRGYRAIAVRNGPELLERAPELHPAMMLVDIQMPVLDGIETIRRLRRHSDPVVAAAPIIAVTALVMEGDREKCIAAGANDYLSKPVVLSQLVQHIRQLLPA